MTFSEALAAAQAGKAISRPSLPGFSLSWITSASTAAGPLTKLKPFLAFVPDQAGIITYQVTPDDMAATDWVAA